MTTLSAFRLVLLLAFLGSCQLTWATTVAPDFSVPDNSGNTITLSALHGKVVYLDFWASWCKPCRESFPWMNRMQQRYKDKNVVFLAVNLDKEHELAEQFLKDNPAVFSIGFDPRGDVVNQYQPVGMPTAYLIDQSGKVQYVHTGFRKNDMYQYEQHIEQLLKSSTSHLKTGTADAH